MLRLSPAVMALNVAGVMTAHEKVETQMSWTSSQALETLAAELHRRGYAAKLITPEGREPWLAVRNPQVPMLAETVLVHAEWFWWPWQDRIGPATDVPAAADRVRKPPLQLVAIVRIRLSRPTLTPPPGSHRRLSNGLLD